MVGHYWLRNSALAPNPDIAKEIEDALTSIKEFVAAQAVDQARWHHRHTTCIELGDLIAWYAGKLSRHFAQKDLAFGFAMQGADT